MRTEVTLAAKTNNTVLITGATGTGKTHLAKQIHEQSSRKDKKFMAINLVTLSENLLESELFGHERGAFSGADSKRIGKMELANDGTVFLDEIGELNPRLQTKLLEVLNSKTISPVGSNREIRLNIRIIAATNKNLYELVQKGLFREDLYYRLNTFEIHLRSLKEEKDKILPLAEVFAQQASKEQNIAFAGFQENLKTKILALDWSGNIRELKNAMEYLVTVAGGFPATIEHLPAYLRASHKPCSPPEEQIQILEKENQTNILLAENFPTDFYSWKEQAEKLYLQTMLLRFQGKINKTSRETGLSKVTLIEKIRRYQINIEAIKFQLYQQRSLS